MALKVRDVRTVAVGVPMTYTLGTSASVVRTAPLLLVDIMTEEDVTGRAYLFCYKPSGVRAIAAVIEEAVEQLKGHVVAPIENTRILERSYALLGVTGIARMALAAIDVALWDAAAIAAKLPLCTMLGGKPGKIQAYNSCGLGLMGRPEAVADEAEKLLALGFDAEKLRLGYPTLAEDLAATRAVRRRIPASARLMADYNQAMTVSEAITRGLALQDEGLTWIEEPIRQDDLEGNARVAAALRLPLQLGENLNGPYDIARALAHDACDLVMPDVARVGGVTGWMQAAGIAHAKGMEMSSHLFPEVSGHLLRATPTAHWLEYVDWADAVLKQPLAIKDGHAVVPDRPGNGLEWDPDKVARIRLDR